MDISQKKSMQYVKFIFFFRLLGKVYNDIGLLYNGLKSYKNAAECFELAIPLMRTENPDKSLEAVLQQNLGAVYNQLKEYNKAMDCHRQAVSLHGKKGFIFLTSLSWRLN